MSDQVFQQFVDQLKSKGFTLEQLAAIVAYETQISSAGLFQMMCAVLTEEDLKQIEEVSDEKQAMQLAEQLFEKRSGMTIQGALEQLQEMLRKTQNYTKQG